MLCFRFLVSMLLVSGCQASFFRPGGARSRHLTGLSPCAVSAAGRRLHARLEQQAAVGFLQARPDTVWLMEALGFEDLRPVGRVWSRTGEAGYSYDPNTKRFTFEEKPFFRHHIRLVQRWDTAALHAERALQHTPGYGLANGTRSIRATRVVRQQGRVECHSFLFTEVVFPKRDFYDAE